MVVDQAVIAQARDWGLLKALFGSTFCFTGTMSVKRTELAALIMMLGGNVQNAVTSTTNYLIVPSDKEYRQGSKYQAALRSGTTIIDEEQFCAMILPSVDELLVKN